MPVHLIVKSRHLSVARTLQSWKSLRSTISEHSVESLHYLRIPKRLTSKNNEPSSIQSTPIDMPLILILPIFYLLKYLSILLSVISKKLVCKRILQSRSYISVAHIQARLKFALKHKDLTVKDVLKVIWSDESKVEIGKNLRVDWILKTVKEKYHVDCLTSVFKSGHSSIMVWGCFTGNRLSPLLTFEKGGISSREYIQTSDVCRSG